MKVLTTRSGFRESAKKYRWVAVSCEILSDSLTPVLFYAALPEGKKGFLLESVVGGEKWGRFSYIGSGIRFRFEGRIDQGLKVTCVANDGNATHAERKGDLLDMLRKELYQLEIDPGGLPEGVNGGLVGYLSYDMVRTFEHLPGRLPAQEEFPDLFFVFPEFLVVFDHVTQKVQIVTWIELSLGEDPDEVFERAEAELTGFVESVRKTPFKPASPMEAPALQFHETPTSEEFKKNVLEAQEHIRAGDIFQIVLSKRFSLRFAGNPLDLYRVLRAINPSPYLFLIEEGGRALVGSSPELLVRVRGGKVDLRPIAGTVRRTGTASEDEENSRQLLADPKERAEHVMLVDLGRNDVGRVAQKGTVCVSEMMTLEKYSHVIHIVSHVEGKLEPGKDMFDVIRAVYPAGTLSGAPKIRAMEIIEELEHMRRGPYAGAIGTLSLTGDCDMAIAIRSIFLNGKDAFFQAGAGIVADSIPEKEDREVQMKAGAMMRALRIANGEEGPWLF
ncbi:MAG: anthranilate synthase component I family protein [Leptospirales bacterium]